MDKEGVAKRIRKFIPRATASKSPQGQDANDLLQKGLLGGVLTNLRIKAAQDETALLRLHDELYRAAEIPQGLDTSSAKAFQQLARQLNKPSSLWQPEKNRSITPS